MNVRLHFVDGKTYLVRQCFGGYTGSVVTASLGGCELELFKTFDQIRGTCAWSLNVEEGGLDSFELDHKAEDSCGRMRTKPFSQEWTDDGIELLQKDVAHTSFRAVEHV